MMNSDYHDNRPFDGQDEREQRRAEQEGADLATLTTFTELIHRLYCAHLIDADTHREVIRANIALVETLAPLLDKEGF